MWRVINSQGGQCTSNGDITLSLGDNSSLVHALLSVNNWKRKLTVNLTKTLVTLMPSLGLHLGGGVLIGTCTI